MFSLWSTPAVFSFSDSIPTEITENVFTVTESFLRKKIFATSLYLGEIVLFWGTKRAILNGQYRSILPARVPNQNSEFAASSPLAELAHNIDDNSGAQICFGPDSDPQFFFGRTWGALKGKRKIGVGYSLIKVRNFNLPYFGIMFEEGS